MYDHSAMYKMGFPCLSNMLYTKEEIQFLSSNWGTPMYLYNENVPKKFYFTNLKICGSKTNRMTYHFLLVKSIAQMV